MSEGAYDELEINVDPHRNTVADIFQLASIADTVNRRDRWAETGLYIDGLYVHNVADDDLVALSKAIDDATWDGPRPIPEWERPGWGEDE